MIDLSKKTVEIIKSLFPVNSQEEVEELLKIECGENIPFFKNHDFMENCP